VLANESLFVHSDTREEILAIKSFTADGIGIDGAGETRSNCWIERRSSPRIYDCFPAKVCCKDLNGKRFEIETVLDNIGARGLYVRLSQRVEPGAEVSVELRLSSANNASVFAPRLVTHGEVLRIEPPADGTFGVAIEFYQGRFL
jgi:hypothetical protein